MQFDYEKNPKVIEQESFREIQSLTQLDGFTVDQQQILMRIVHSTGIPEIVNQVKFSSHACERGLDALSCNAHILCDVEMVKQGVTKRLIQREPWCFLNTEKTRIAAKETGHTRSMVALHAWFDLLQDSLVIIGNAPTALFRLLEMLDDGAPKPALIIGMPVGFVGAAESKQALWGLHQQLDIECITLLGREGGSAVAAATCNALLRCNAGEYYS